MLVVCENNNIICKIPSDQTKFLNSLKQIIAKQKQNQQLRVILNIAKIIWAQFILDES
jgi:hypothetical protein